MKITPLTVVLKNGKQIIIREALVTDAANLRTTIMQFIDESIYIPQTSDEYRFTEEGQRAWIQEFIDKENSMMLIAEFEGRIIGNIDINGHTRKAMKHTGGIGMGMLDEWRNQGLGTALICVGGRDK